MKILFICTKNNFESQLAEAFAEEINKKEKMGFVFQSAGLNAKDGEKLPENTLTTAKNFGLFLSEKKTKRLTEDMIKNADLVFTMNVQQAVALRSYYIEDTEKIFALSNDIYNNEGKNEVYKNCAEEIKKAVTKLFEKMKNGNNKSDSE